MRRLARITVCFLFVASAASLVMAGSPGSSSPTDSPFLYPEYSKTISMDFKKAALEDVLKVFSEQSNLNLITSENIANRYITMYLDKVPVEQALEQLLKANNLTYEIQPGSNIYIVKGLTQLDDEVVTRVYPLKYATVSQSQLKKIISIKSSSDQDTESSVAPEAETGIKGSISGILTVKGKVIEDPRTNSLVITDIATNFPRIESTLARLDVPVTQILIEVEMLEVDKGATEKIGIKVGETPLTFTGGQRAVLYPWNQNKLLNKGMTWASQTISDDGAEYFSGLVDASGLTAILQLLKTDTGTKSLARPTILTLNNEPAQIKIVTQEAIGVSSQTESSQSIATQSLEAERTETGVILTVTPQANVETGEITMAIVPKVIVTREGAIFQGQRFLDPEERGTQSLLRVKSGETIILGGLMREERRNVVTKVPFLGDIPVVGQLFTHKDESSNERELVIFITPYLMDDLSGQRSPPAAVSRAFVREQDNNARLTEVDSSLKKYEQTIN